MTAYQGWVGGKCLVEAYTRGYVEPTYNMEWTAAIE